MDTAHEVVMTLSAQFDMSDAEIAKRIGSSQPTVWRLRSGKTKDCTADLYRKLCLLREEVVQNVPKLGADDTPQSQSLSGTAQRLPDTPPTTQQEAA
jgi:transcriptional regulator with XRE-family HTH domain